MRNTSAGPRTAGLLALVLLATPGCLVLNVHPAYDEETIAWDPALLGGWVDADDNVTVQIEKSEWNSYRIHYAHPIESGDLTGYLTMIGDEKYLDVMPARGQDRGSFLVPVHAVLRVKLEGDRLEVTALSYDWFLPKLRVGSAVSGLSVALDQKQNALIVSSSSRLRDWLRRQPIDGAMFGAAAVFTRKSKPAP